MSDIWTGQTHFGDVREVLKVMIAAGVKVQTIVTSPPYWGLRSYLPVGHPDKHLELGSEKTFAEFLQNMVGIFKLAHQVLADDGVLFMNMGDSYANDGKWGGQTGGKQAYLDDENRERVGREKRSTGLPPKSMIGQPWRLAFALQDDGWILRQDIVWSKKTPMPESVRDRFTKSHEFLFLLVKQPRYYWDFEAAQEPVTGGANARKSQEALGLKRPGFGHGYDEEAKPRYLTPAGWDTGPGAHRDLIDRYPTQPDPNVGRRVTKVVAPKTAASTGSRREDEAQGERMGREPGWRVKNNESFAEATGDLRDLRDMRNRRTVWHLGPEPYSEAHYATFPTTVVEPCILVGSRPGDIVMDIFMGSGTTAQVAQQLGRRWIGIDLDRRNEKLQDKRVAQQSLELMAGDNE